MNLRPSLFAFLRRFKWPLLTFVLGLLVGIFVLFACGFFAVLEVNRSTLVQSALRDSTEGRISVAASCCHAYCTDYGAWPPTLAALTQNKENRVYYSGPHPVSTDAWGNQFVYTPGATPATFAVITSLGSDGLPGGTGSATDISYQLSDRGMIRPWSTP